MSFLKIVFVTCLLEFRFFLIKQKLIIFFVGGWGLTGSVSRYAFDNHSLDGSSDGQKVATIASEPVVLTKTNTATKRFDKEFFEDWKEISKVKNINFPVQS